MSEFRRELRYAVFKLKHLSQEQLEYLDKMPGREDLPPLQCVAVESDWPIYEETWENVQRCAEGRPSLREELDAITRLKARWQAEELVNYHHYRHDAIAKGREPMSAHEWASEVMERARVEE